MSASFPPRQANLRVEKGQNLEQSFPADVCVAVAVASCGHQSFIHNNEDPREVQDKHKQKKRVNGLAQPVLSSKPPETSNSLKASHTASRLPAWKQPPGTVPERPRCAL